MELRVVLLPMKADAQVLKGHLDMLLLAALEDGPKHGYAVREALREASGGRLDLPTGTVYPALRRVEQAGLIAGSWSIVDGRRRRTYQLTEAGRKRLHADRRAWRDFVDTVSALLDSRAWPATT
jgi:PadR family transcriptional regulator PadR